MSVYIAQAGPFDCGMSYMPGYAKGAIRFSYPEKVVDPVKRKTLDKRSRGKHCPGDGAYEHRIVKGNDPYVMRNGTRYLFSFDYSYHEVRSLFNQFYWRFTWDGIRYVCTKVYRSQSEGWMVQTSAFVTMQRGWPSSYYYVPCNHWDYYSGPFGDSDSALAHAKEFAAGEHSKYGGMSYDKFRPSTTISFYPLSGITEADIINPEPKFSNSVLGYSDRIAIDDPTLHSTSSGIASAYVDACDRIPSLSDMNNVQNVVELLKGLLGAFIALFTGNGLTLTVGSLRTILKDAWLGYRYVYNTTKADLKEIAEYADRIMDMDLSQGFRSNGFYRNGEFTYRCCLRIEANGFADLQSTLQRYGLELNAYDLWDFVPFSFIVDWFLAIGDWLEAAEASKFALTCRRECWCSVERRWKNEFGFDEIYYYRFLYEPDPRLALLNHTSSDASGKLIVKRLLDLVALFLL